MAVLSKEEFFSRIHDRIGADTSDESIAFIEDLTDTYNDMERKAAGDGTDWEKKYRELDESWKKRYKHRFFSGGDTGEPYAERGKEEPEEIEIEDLFEEEKEEK